MQEDVVNVESSPEKDDKQDVKVAIAKVNKAQQHPESQLLMIVPGMPWILSYQILSSNLFWWGRWSIGKQ